MTEIPTEGTVKAVTDRSLSFGDLWEQLKSRVAAEGMVLSEKELCDALSRWMITVAFQSKAANLPPSLGYEPLLIENGFSPMSARGIASIAVGHGRRLAAEAKVIRRVHQAIRFMARSGRQKGSLQRHARCLLDAWSGTSIVETIFVSAGLHESQFISLMTGLLEGNDVDVAGIADVAARLVPHLETSRGPKISAASAAHEFILRESPELGALRSPQRSRARGRLRADALTEATRREFRNENFDSRPVARRLKRDPG